MFFFWACMYIFVMLCMVLSGSIGAAELLVAKKMPQKGCLKKEGAPSRKAYKKVAFSEGANANFSVAVPNVLVAARIVRSADMPSGITVPSDGFFLHTSSGIRELCLVKKDDKQQPIPEWCSAFLDDLETKRLRSAQEIIIPWKELAAIPAAGMIHDRLALCAKVYAVYSLTKSLWDKRQAVSAYQSLKKYDVTERLGVTVADADDAVDEVNDTTNQFGYVQKQLAQGARAMVSPYTLPEREFHFARRHAAPGEKDTYSVVFTDDTTSTVQEGMLQKLKIKLWGL